MHTTSIKLKFLAICLIGLIFWIFSPNNCVYAQSEVVLNEEFETWPPIGFTTNLVSQATEGDPELPVGNIPAAASAHGTYFAAMNSAMMSASKTPACVITSPELNLTKLSGATLSFIGYFIDYSMALQPASSSIGVLVEESEDGVTYTKIEDTIKSVNLEAWQDYAYRLQSTTKYVRISSFIFAQGINLFCFDGFRIEGTAAYTNISESFEASFPPVDWTVESKNEGEIMWSKTIGGGDYPTAYDKTNYTTVNVSEGIATKTYLCTPELDLGLNARLEFMYYIDTFSDAGTHSDSKLEVETSTDGINFKKILTLTDTDKKWSSSGSIKVNRNVKYIRFAGSYTKGKAVGPCLDMVKIYTPAAVSVIDEGFESGSIPYLWVKELTSTDPANGYVVDLHIFKADTMTEEMFAPTQMPENGGEYGFFYNCGRKSGGDGAILTTPVLDLTGNEKNIVSFYYWDKQDPENDVDDYRRPNIRIEYTTDGNSWIEHKYMEPISKKEWIQYVANIPNSAKQLRFKFNNNGTGTKSPVPPYDAFFDQFYIGVQNCVTPSKISVQKIKQTTAELQIEAFDDETAYKVACGTSPEFKPEDYKNVVRTSGQTTTIYNIQGLKASTNYYISVRTACSENSSVARNLSFKTADECLAPSIPTVVEVAANKIKISWKENGSANKWIVGFAQSEITVLWANATKIETDINNNFSVNVPKDNTSYGLAVKSICALDSSVQSEAVFVKTPPLCPAPASISAQDVNPHGFTVVWPKAGDATTYEVGIVRFDQEDQTAYDIKTVEGNSYTFTNLRSGSTYRAVVRAYCDEEHQSVWEGVFGGAVVTLPCTDITENDMPFEESFEEGATWRYRLSPCMLGSTSGSGYVISTRGSEWYGSTAHSGRFYVGIQSHGLDETLAADDYMFIPAAELKAGTTYELSYYAKLTAFKNNIKAGRVKDSLFILTNVIGKGDTAVANLTKLEDPHYFTVKNDTAWGLCSAKYTVEEDGTYHFGIHIKAKSATDFQVVFIDDMRLRIITNCAEVEDISIGEVRHNTADISWNVSKVAPQYQVRYGVSTTYPAVYDIVTVNAQEAELTKLNPTTPYKFQVRAICGENDTSSWSSVKSFVTGLTCPPPTNIHIEATTTDGFKVAFTPSYSDIKYAILCNEGVDYPSNIEEREFITDAGKVYSGLKHSSYYSIRLRSECEAEKSAWQEIRTTTSCAPFELPYSQDFEQMLETEQPPCIVGEGDDLTRMCITGGFEASVYSHSGNGFIYGFGPNNILWMPEVKMEAGKRYNMSVWAQCAFYKGGVAGIVFYKKGEDGKPSKKLDTVAMTTIKDQLIWTEAKERFVAPYTGNYSFGIKYQSAEHAMAIDDFTITPICEDPTNLRVSDITASTAMLSWNKEENVDSCLVEYRKNGVERYTKLYTKNNSILLKGLDFATQYEWRVACINRYGYSDHIEGSIFVTADCQAPENLKAENITYESAELSWKAGNSKEYEVRIRKFGSTDKYRTEISTASLLKLEGLSASTKYEWAVRGKCNTDFSQWVEGANFTTLSLPCIKPAGLSAAYNEKENIVSFNWFGDADNYALRYKLGRGGVYTQIYVDANEYTLRSPLKGDYVWAVRSVCAAGDSSQWTEGDDFVVVVNNEDMQKAGISVYNTDGKVYVKSSSLLLQKVEIIDIRGRKICSKVVNFTETVMDCNFAGEAYLVQVYADNKVYTIKISLIK